MAAIRRFYESEAEYEEFCGRLKLTACPHCRRIGTLNRHGCLTGQKSGVGPQSQEIVRGRRFLCSNRHQRPGCGRTFSLLACDLLCGFVLTALMVWRFLKALAAGALLRAAFRTTGSRQHLRGASRLRQRFQQGCSWLRTLLLRRCAAPDPPPGTDILGQTVAHLQAAFPGHPCPVAAFQSQFQVRFF